MSRRKDLGTNADIFKVTTLHRGPPLDLQKSTHQAIRGADKKDHFSLNLNAGEEENDERMGISRTIKFK